MDDLDLTETPVLDTLVGMTAVSLELCNLDAETLMLVRIAALAASGAPAASYLVNAGAAADSGVTLASVQDVLVAIAPIVGSAKVLEASGNITAALGFAIAAVEEMLDAGGA